jgi:HlyD family secretion protein
MKCKLTERSNGATAGPGRSVKRLDLINQYNPNRTICSFNIRRNTLVNKKVLLTAALLSLIITVNLISCTKTNPATSSSPAVQSPTQTASPQSSPGSNQGQTRTPGSQAGPTQTAQPSSPTTQTKTVSGAGVISVATYANLYFGTAGQIKTIRVKQGDTVTKGTILAKLDTLNLELAVAQAKVNLDQAKLTQIQGQSALQTAQFNLDKTQAISDIKDAITSDQWALKIAQVNVKTAGSVGDASIASLNQYTADIQKSINNSTAKLTALLNTTQYADVKAYYTSITVLQQYDLLTVEDIQMKALAISSAKQALDKSQDVINQAQKSLDLAQTQLDQATIVAPFDGLIATVNQNEQDIVSAPSQTQRPIIYIIDPSTMQLIIGVNELDMPKVSLNQKAAISLDAFPGVKLTGQVTAISPLPTVQGGIVDYMVTTTFSVPSNTAVRVGMNGSASIAVQ